MRLYYNNQEVPWCLALIDECGRNHGSRSVSRRFDATTMIPFVNGVLHTNVEFYIEMHLNVLYVNWTTFAERWSTGAPYRVITVNVIMWLISLIFLVITTMIISFSNTTHNLIPHKCDVISWIIATSTFKIISHSVWYPCRPGRIPSSGPSAFGYVSATFHQHPCRTALESSSRRHRDAHKVRRFSRDLIKRIACVYTSIQGRREYLGIPLSLPSLSSTTRFW